MPSYNQDIIDRVIVPNNTALPNTAIGSWWVVLDVDPLFFTQSLGQLFVYIGKAVGDIQTGDRVGGVLASQVLNQAEQIVQGVAPTGAPTTITLADGKLNVSMPVSANPPFHRLLVPPGFMLFAVNGDAAIMRLKTPDLDRALKASI